MPPHANSLAEEGVVIPPTLLIDGGDDCFSTIEKLLTEAPFPTRNLRDNIADLNAQLAANRRGQSLFEGLLSDHGVEKVSEHMSTLKSQSLDALECHLDAIAFHHGEATEKLDDGTPIAVSVSRSGERLVINFTGTGSSHPSNLHATPAIVQSAILYVLRLWTQSQVPLNEGMLESVDIVLPTCFLNPEFSEDATDSPAVVGGNVETSQRVVDCLIRALGLQACSQGTMNNFLFGNESFGYYETICGGSGAGTGYNGTSGIHTHMTNTAITDPEILESRYPVRLREFSIRRGSGGKGKWHGGDGVIREVEFLKSLQVSLLSQHRIEKPFGIDGGESGECGKQFLNGEALPGAIRIEAKPGDVLRIETPGGGGAGKPIRQI
jgi:5-oxoprolinase (ATP-hydrolysing)